jgi:hypothetical protein
MNKRKKRFDLNGNPLEADNPNDHSGMNLVDMSPPVHAKPGVVSDYRTANPRIPPESAYRRMETPYPGQNAGIAGRRRRLDAPKPTEGSEDTAPLCTDARDAMDELLAAELRTEGTPDEIAAALTERITAYLERRADVSPIPAISDTHTYVLTDDEIRSRVRKMLGCL